jgi:hypothetical protein
MTGGFAPSDIDTSRPHPARMYDFYLGGKDNYMVDRNAAREVLRAAPELLPEQRTDTDIAALRRKAAELKEIVADPLAPALRHQREARELAQLTAIIAGHDSSRPAPAPVPAGAPGRTPGELP